MNENVKVCLRSKKTTDDFHSTKEWHVDPTDYLIIALIQIEWRVLLRISTIWMIVLIENLSKRWAKFVGIQCAYTDDRCFVERHYRSRQKSEHNNGVTYYLCSLVVTVELRGKLETVYFYNLLTFTGLK